MEPTTDKLHSFAKNKCSCLAYCIYIMGELIILPIKFYQLFISPILPRTCRFYPTCSQYAIIAIRRYGPIKGTVLAIKRILRCHPGNPGGFDPVP